MPAMQITLCYTSRLQCKQWSIETDRSRKKNPVSNLGISNKTHEIISWNLYQHPNLHYKDWNHIHSLEWLFLNLSFKQDVIIRWSTLCGSRKYPYPPTEDHWKFRGLGGFMGNYFPKSDRPCTKHGKQRTIDLKHKNIPTYVVWKQKSVLLAIDMRLTSLALMFLFFFDLASATISRRTMCLWSLVFVSFSSDQH